MMKVQQKPILNLPELIHAYVYSTATALGVELMAHTQTHDRRQRCVSAPNPSYPTSPLYRRDEHGRRAGSRSPALLRYLTARRRAAGGVAGERWREKAQFPPSLPVVNSLMKFRSEEQRRKHSYTVVAVFTHLSACLSACLLWYFSVFLYVSLHKLGLRLGSNPLRLVLLGSG